MTETDLDILAKKVAQRLFQPKWLKLRQAAMYSGIGQKKLKIMAENGDIIGYQDDRTAKGIWRFDRESIDDYMMEPVNELKKILDEMGI